MFPALRNNIFKLVILHNDTNTLTLTATKGPRYVSRKMVKICTFLFKMFRYLIFVLQTQRVPGLELYMIQVDPKDN